MPSPRDLKNVIKAVEETKAAKTGAEALAEMKAMIKQPKGVWQGVEPFDVWQDKQLAKQLEAELAAKKTEAPKIKLGGDKTVNKKKQFIEDVYSKYAPHPFMGNQRVISEGAGDQQKFAQFELKPGFGKDEVEIDWISAYPQRSGMGTKAIKELQQHAQDAGITLTLYPWDKGQVSQRALTSFYKGLGFQPITKDSKTLAWKPEAIEAEVPAAPLDIETQFIQEKAGGGAITKALKALEGVKGAEKAAQDIRALAEANRPLTALEKQYLAEMSARQGEELVRLRPQEMAPVAAKKSAGPSPKPARAKPKSKEEISAIAERIAPQLTGEFVRGEKGTTSVAGKSRKQFDIEQELEHEMQRSREVPEVETVDLEPYRGNVMLSLPGDTSISDYDIFSIGGEGLRAPSRQYGGPRFGLGHPEEAGWASGLVPTAGFQRRVNAASEQYGGAPVLANYMSMGPEGLNYALHLSDALLKSAKPEMMTERNINDFNKIIRAGNPKSEFLDFPGIEHPEATYLYLAENPEARKHFNSVMQLTKTTEALGLPSGLNVRHAVTEPELRDLERGMTGFSLMEMQPGVSNLKPSKHPTYSHDIPGKFVGRTDVLYPYELTFPDTVAGIRANPKQAGSEFGTLQMLGGKQIIDNQLLDELARYRERIKELTGKAEGGAVHMADGGDTMFAPAPLQIPSKVTGFWDKLKAQVEKEYQSLSKPGALTDIFARGIVAPAMGLPAEIVGFAGEALDHVQKTHPLTRKPASVMDPTGKTLGYAPKLPLAPEGEMPYGMAEAQNLMNQAGITTGTERPLTELATMFASPAAARGAVKAGKVLAPTAKEMLEAGLEKAVAPTRMYAVPPEAGAPGKVKAPANDVGFYNPAEKAALNLQRKKGAGSAFISDLKKQPGVTDERLEELGLTQFADKPNVTKEEIIAAAQQNRIPLRESIRTEEGDISEASRLLDRRDAQQRFVEELEQKIAAAGGADKLNARDAYMPQKLEDMKAELDRLNDQIYDLRPADFSPSAQPDYSTPGGENYREIRVGLPSNKKKMSYEDWRRGGMQGEWSSTGTVGEDFMHPTHHGKKPNVLFHLRVSDFKDAEGKNGLLIDELQSDWHQTGREKGYTPKDANKAKQEFFDYAQKLKEKYKTQIVNPNQVVQYSPSMMNALAKELGMTEGEANKYLELQDRFLQNRRSVPDAPFKENWYQLGLKRAIKEAVDSGKERVYLTTGEAQAKRYDLSQHIDELSYQDGTLYGYKGDHMVVSKQDIPEDKLSDYVGKETAKKILSQEPNLFGARIVSGLDMKMGGEGMRQYYDKTYKNYLEKYAKKFGGKLGMTQIMTHSPEEAQIIKNNAARMYGEDSDTYRQVLKNISEPVYYIDITPEMRKSAKLGQSYKEGGSVHMAEGGSVDIESKLNRLLGEHVAGMAEGGSVDLESKLNGLLSKHVQSMADGGAVEENRYNSDPDMSDGGLFVQAPPFAEGGAVKSIWTVN
jgi:hypothetical protein